MDKQDSVALNEGGPDDDTALVARTKSVILADSWTQNARNHQVGTRRRMHLNFEFELCVLVGLFVPQHGVLDVRIKCCQP